MKNSPGAWRRVKASGLFLALLITGLTALAGSGEPLDPTVAPMRGLIDRYAEDLGNLERFYDVRFSETTFERLHRFNAEYQQRLGDVDFSSLDQAGKVDYLLFRTHLEYERKNTASERTRTAEALAMVPWVRPVVEMIEARQRVEPMDPAAAAENLHAIHQEIKESLDEWRQSDTTAISPTLANRTAGILDQLNRHLREWVGFYDGYHPAFSWWVSRTAEAVRSSIDDCAQWLRKNVAGYRDGEDPPLLGDPIGREALLDALQKEWIPYTPEELVEIARSEMAWCLNERRKAARELGFGDDWKAAQDHVKTLHVAPGEQPQLIRELALEAEKFLDDRELLTIPEVARETWRMRMMSPERQKVNPYFTGGEVISVSFPTAEMSHDHKLMSMRGNNIHFSRATVHHELIPGHHLQLYMAERYNAHRKLFRTPFLIEGWALYWEMLLWDLDFAHGPEDRIGMLFWRSHRCARIIFSLSFHLGTMSPQECIDYLVENVGHEVRNATAEVRRSIQGGYSPLYQAAYMLGGLQLRQLSRELVDGQGWSPRKFHDAVLRENSIPVELIRASLSDGAIGPESSSNWRFYPRNVIEAEAGSAAPAKERVTTRHDSEEGGKKVAVATDSGTRPRAYRAQVEPKWFGNNSKFWYRVETADDRFEFVTVDAEAGTRRPSFDHQAVAALIGKETGKAYAADQLPVDSLEFSEDGKTITLLGPEGGWILDTENGSIKAAGNHSDIGLAKYDEMQPSGANGPETEIRFVNNLKETVQIFWVDSEGERRHYHDVDPEGSITQHTYAGHSWAVFTGDGEFAGCFIATARPGTAYLDDSAMVSRENRRRRSGPRGAADSEDRVQGVVSPDGRWRAFTRDHNLFVEDQGNGAILQLTSDGDEDDSYQQNGQREKFMGMRYDFEGYPEWQPRAWWSPDSRHLIAMKTTRVPERLVHMVQSSPKDQLQPQLHTIPYFKPGDPIPVEKPHLFDVVNGREIPVDDGLFPTPWSLSRMDWLPDSSEFLFVYNQRGHQVMRLIAIDGKTGNTRAVIDETCGTFFDYAGKFFLRLIPETGEALWMSERSGWNHLYLYDIASGSLKNAVTSGPFVVRGVERVDVQDRSILLTAGGLNSSEDPYFVHYCRVNFDGSGFMQLTGGDGTHRITPSPDGRFFIDEWSRVDMAPVHQLRDFSTGALITTLETGTTAAFQHAGQSLPDRFTAPGRDGITPIHGIIHWPDQMEPGKTYPVIESIYAGPHSAHVPKSFRNTYRQKELANLGFIVVQIDGMGTSHRSKAFHDVCWKNIADAGFPDRIAWIRAAAREFPVMDISKVGIYGGSAGGQNALAALLQHGDFYTAGVADCGCHDNRMDKIWWNELWMSYPIDDHYEAQSNVTLAPALKGDLLLLVGELDKNVDPASTMQVVNSLIEADRDFEMLMMPNTGHGAAGSAYGWRKLERFFQEHMLGR